MIFAPGMLATMAVDGEVAPGFEPVRDTFEQVVEAQAGTGAAVACWHDGRWVVDLWGGWADADRTRPWRRDTLVMPYSVTKAFTAVCALVLVDRGALDLDAPLQKHWPQLRAEGTLRQLLSHQVGIVALDEPAPPELLLDWHRLCDRLAATAPLWPAGTAVGESALFYGHLVGEVVRRVDGRSLGRFLREEVSGPHALDFAIGLDDPELARTADLTRVDELAASLRAPGRPELLARALLNPPGAVDQRVVNSTPWRRAEVPAVSGHGTARAVAGLHAALLRGRVLDPGVVREMTTAQARGVDRVLGGPERSWGLGVAVEDDGFGMGGSGGSLGWASTDGGYAYGFVTGTMGDHDRAGLVEDALREVLDLPPL